MTSSEKSPLLSSRGSTYASRKPVLVIHGGAGAITREGSTPERREMYKEALRKALLRGYRVLQAGGEAMDAAVAAVTVMEGEYTNAICSNLTCLTCLPDNPLFNSGKGAVFNVAGKVCPLFTQVFSKAG